MAVNESGDTYTLCTAPCTSTVRKPKWAAPGAVLSSVRWLLGTAFAYSTATAASGASVTLRTSSPLIVAVSIPLSILASISLLYALGHTLNVMTLGGLALAVGVLVDDATVEVENVHRNLAEKKPLLTAAVA